jgi:stage V sporulation protein B
MAIGEISNLFVLLIFYNKRKDRKNVNSKTGIIRKRSIVKEIVAVTIPVSFNRLITSGLNAGEQILIPRRLMAGGLSYHLSIEVFGRLSGMAMPLITFPCLVTSSLATTLVPAISEAISVKNFKTLNHRINKSIEITFVLGFVFTSVFCSYANEIGDLLYPSENIGPMLYGLSFACIFIYLQQTLLGVLNGLGKQLTSLQNSIIGSGIRIGFLYLFVPTYGVKGYFIGIFISSLLVCILNMVTVVKTTGMTINLGNWLIKPTLASLILIISARYVYSFFAMLGMPVFLTTITSAGALCMAGLLLMTILGVLDINDILNENY